MNLYYDKYLNIFVLLYSLWHILEYHVSFMAHKMTIIIINLGRHVLEEWGCVVEAKDVFCINDTPTYILMFNISDYHRKDAKSIRLKIDWQHADTQIMTVRDCLIVEKLGNVGSN